MRYPGGPHAAARTAVVWEVLRRELSAPAVVLDVGGGTGGFAVPLAAEGHDVTVVDASPDSLAALTRRATEEGVAGRVHALQGDADSLAGLVPPSTVDLVLCHSVLETVDSPVEVMVAIAGVLRPGGAVSVLVANRFAAALARAMAGQFAAAAALVSGLVGASAVDGAGQRQFDRESAVALIGKAGLVVEEVHGVRIVADLVPASVAERDPAALAEFELAAASVPPLRDIAAQVHLLARRP